ncbi:MAG: ABC transporter ATP-binding protein [Leptospirales bacterium]|jgi:ABC-2 type transport system ATP-binding protein
MGVIECESLSKSYGSHPALSDLDLSVERGEIFGFLGPNGAGKTTFIKILLHFIAPSGGDIRILGAKPGELDRTRIGYLPERINIHPFLSGREFLRFQGRLIGLAGKDLEGRIDKVLERVEMSAAGDRRVGDYSKGMTQRVGLAQALLGEPELLLLDEPASGLDPLGIARIREIMLAERDRGATVFFNSHQLLEVEKTCDRVAILNRGRVAAQGKSQDLSSRQGVRLEIDGPADALGKVSELARNLDSSAQIEQSGARIELSIADPEQERLFPAKVVDAGARIVKYARQLESLEDVFQRLVGGAEGES